jgi:hypothetical protein
VSRAQQPERMRRVSLLIVPLTLHASADEVIE